ncbi:Activator of Hsp90 ATPase homolog 1-like protein [Mycolicibacterium rutilum]|uniref:Activator of Hsp90 ATPase homolog 1-like protein n=1 Tax=Mycolicibacterium rutilum TaxID=370526 RepID=A0A1H6KTG3_MYCRU|nr:SRPBCC family protein [Mycolicibacterium rutilum]SEH78840.1 Activator of Hsp90 ATPase homolog 1-like protein [Mycolicibacterium rutilum]
MTEIDVDHQINAVQRKLGTRTIDAGEAHVVTISQTYDTDRDDLWDAVTNIERIPRWLMPISGELKIGGSYQLHGNAGGTVLTCDPPKNFTATWEYAGNVSWIDVTVDAEDERARLVIEHIAVVGDEMALQFGPGAVGIGWDSMVLGLALHLATGESIDPGFGEQWVTTPEGRRFLALSNEAWYQENVAAGADPAEARGAADRCLAAYYGEG